MKYKTPVVSIVGKSNSGKTTLIVKLVKELKLRGYKVATIKHSHHQLELDTQGKDSWQHTQAGADAVIVASRNIMGVIRKTPTEHPLPEIVNTYLHDMDIVVVEGYKSEDIPKIEVLRTEVGAELVCKTDKHLLAVIGNQNPEINVPFFHADDKISDVVDFLLSRLGISM